MATGTRSVAPKIILSTDRTPVPIVQAVRSDIFGARSSPAITRGRYRNQPHVERQFARLELADGWTKIACRLILLLLAVAFAAASIIYALHGLSWLVPTGMATSSAVSGVVSAIDR